jgi:rhodanese-related sulfurtransferase
MKSKLGFILVAIIFGAISGAVTVNYLSDNNETVKTQEELIKEFYEVETAVHVSPHHIRKDMDKGKNNVILVDLRSQEEYEREHVIGAVNIPAYKDPFTSAYGDVERIVGEFSKLDKSKEIIVYCYSIPCMTGRKIGKMLADHDIYVKHLGIGWNEWRYSWEQWNHEHEWAVTNVEGYVVSGSEPGTPKLNEDAEACAIENEFGC